MPMLSAQAIYDQIRRTEGDIDKQIQELRSTAAEYGVGVEQLKDGNGSYILTPLLVAKASCLNGIAVLKAADMKKR